MKNLEYAIFNANRLVGLTALSAILSVGMLGRAVYNLASINEQIELNKPLLVRLYQQTYPSDISRALLKSEEFKKQSEAYFREYDETAITILKEFGISACLMAFSVCAGMYYIRRKDINQ